MDRYELNEEDVQVELEKLLVLREAKRRLAEESNPYELPTFTNLTEVPDGKPYRIDDLLPSDGYVLLSAQKKAGKTTMVHNLIKSLTRGKEFLGEFRVQGRSRVALIDLEMSPRQLGLWLRDAGLLGEKKLFAMTLRGMAKALGLDDEDRQDKIAQDLIDLGIDVLIVDPLGPLMRAYGIDENSNSDVGRIIDGLIALKEKAGVSELVITHHHGKDNDLGARGASVLADTPDALWQLKRDDRTGRSSLSAYGRDVDARRDLVFDPDTRALTTMRFDDVYVRPDNRQLILDALRAGGPMSGRTLFNQIKPLGYSSREDKINDDLRELEGRGEVTNVGTGKWAKWTLSDEV